MKMQKKSRGPGLIGGGGLGGVRGGGWSGKRVGW